jgi:hypothetical protein
MTAVHTGPAIMARTHLWTERSWKYYIDTGIVYVNAPALVVEPSLPTVVSRTVAKAASATTDGGLH